MESNIDIFHRPIRGYEELSFFGDDNHGHETVPNVDIVDNLILNDDHLLSPKDSPKRFEIISKTQRPTPHHKSTETSQWNRSPPINIRPINIKRYKTETYSASDKENIKQQPILTNHISMKNLDIINALSRLSIEPDLIGDFSKPFCLPLIDGMHEDLKSISRDTLAKLISGAFKDSVASYKIIDCRYPYEFDGGHIRGAKNLFTQEHIMEEFVNCKTGVATVDANAPKRHILVFHCEFSSKRGPKLSRFLRNNDRARNTDSYPALHYPEIYLLHGGYQEFYEKYSALCDPVSYRSMLEPGYAKAYKHFRAQSRKNNFDTKCVGVTVNRIEISGSRLVL